MCDVLAVACLAAFCAIGYMSYGDLVGVQDIGVYRNIADRADHLFQGIPDEVRAEYPPLATLFFWVAMKIQWLDFVSAWIAVVTSACIVTWAYLRTIGRNLALAFALMLPMAAVILGHEIVFGRFDIFVALFLILSIATYERGRTVQSSLFLMLAACVKIVPLIGFPFLLAAVPRHKWKHVVLGALLGLGVTVLLSISVLGWQGTIDNVHYMVTYHEDRGLQLESTWSSALMLFGSGVMKNIPTGVSRMSVVNLGVGSTLAASLSKFIVLGGLATLFLWSVRKKKTASFGILLVCALLWSLFATPVLSPQYIVWVIPIVLLFLIQSILRGERHDAFLATTLLTIGIAGLTQWIFPHNYQSLIGQDPLPVILLALRNVGLLALLFSVAFYGGVFVPRLVLRHPNQPRKNWGIHFGLDTILLSVASLLFFVVRPGMIPQVTQVQYMTHGTLHSAPSSLPFALYENSLSEFSVQADVVLTKTSQHRYFRIRQDDCLQVLNVNGHGVPSDLTGYCDGNGPGRIFDLGAYMHPGANTIAAVVRNTGGGIGFDFTPVSTPLLVLIVLLFGITVVWYVLQLVLFLPALRDLSVHFTQRIGYTLQRLWTRSHSKTGISSTASADRKIRLSI